METPEHSGSAESAVYSNLISQLEAAKFTRLVRHLANLPIDADNLRLPAMAHGLSRTELFVRMFGKMSALGSWAATWVFQPAYLPIGLWSEPAALSSLKRSITQVWNDLQSQPDLNSILYGISQREKDVYQYPVAMDAFYYLVTNYASQFSAAALDQLSVHFRSRFGKSIQQFGVATPQSVAQREPEQASRYVFDLLNMPSSYYFVAREGSISVVPATEHGWYLVGRGELAAPATATSTLSLQVPGLSDLEALVNSRLTSERDLQKFLEENPHFLFALDERYSEVRSHVGLVSPAETSLIPDFVIRLEDSSRWDMLELKKPLAPITTKKGFAGSAGQHAAHAIKQLMEYTDAVSTRAARSLLTDAYGASPYEPCLLVLIGRGSPRSQFRWRSPRLGLPDVRLVTYDFLMERARSSRALIDGMTPSALRGRSIIRP
ncbi:Shedu anti-phage system protein SduA domain-containing protein [Sphingomonas paucimobilis]|uniref:Shedu anti-phage system protein SduA domain-containing protein n=1 Tax=Sphingomonas paucimobilis TaxID=13689 RepID=UPI0028D6DA64|nr:Shedu anti-phage system protein SduA domain-containing protein [Sphingomonas paucimobilis]